MMEFDVKNQRKRALQNIKIKLKALHRKFSKMFGYKSKSLQI